VNEPGIKLLERYLSSQVSDTERQDVDSWLSANNISHEQLKEMINLPEGVKVMLRQNVDASWEHVNSEVGRRKTRSTTLSVVRIAASVAIFIGAACALYLGVYKELTADSLHVVANDSVAPLEVRLPDSSRVYLRSGSQISYRDHYNKERTVQLQGEAFFEVRHNPENAFVINVDSAQVLVVGTSFNVRDNANQLDVIVATGRVSVYTPGNDHMYLNMGESSMFDKATKVITKIKNDDMNYQSWKTGVLEFDNTPIANVAEVLERHFKIKVTVRGEGANRLTYTSRFLNAELNDVLSEMRDVLDVVVRKEGNKVTIVAK
jgi:transmembrane sensor